MGSPDVHGRKLQVLQISDDQMAILHDAGHEQFLRRLQAHLREHFPGRFASVPEVEFRRSVADTVAHARDLGLRSERAICMYVDVAAAFGRGFEAAGQEWAGSIAPAPGERLEPDWIERAVRVAVRTLERRRASPAGQGAA